MTEKSAEIPRVPGYPTEAGRPEPGGWNVSRGSHRATSILFFLAGFIWIWTHFQDPSSSLQTVRIVAASVHILAAIFLWCTRFNLMTEVGDGMIDEWERTLRDRARSIAYTILAIAVTLASMTLTASDEPPTKAQLGVLLHVAFLIAWTLPGIVLAWIAPDPVPEEE